MPKIKLEIQEDEALVLFEFLSRYSDSETLEIEDASEEKTLWNLHCHLEQQLSDIFSSAYRDKLKQARLKINGIG